MKMLLATLVLGLALGVSPLGVQAQPVEEPTFLDEVRFMPGLMNSEDQESVTVSAITPAMWDVKLAERTVLEIGVFDIGLDQADEAAIHAGLGACLNSYITVCASGIYRLPVQSSTDDGWGYNITSDLSKVWRDWRN